ncbi:pregnancy zone protein precursor [Homo sapiens]|uniref:Pregnancy zone protein n=1 Tax=Homo sapiens TaxID=9606 RepID=PZP_HUMAN|nr:pregnancy zone protein precursor [Homo sapiens]P20742.4 RecName: Full=Pregnancy zone protein; AltName: Full=C3 and PZP-like alpha-2-macroglobulin domain-containing protein 6; Flags: Precursor [Homo sapiens]|eukprot:NP_002855.2 pregnancy zone protein precursor [Homo sapiens]
MRKDRLLHLCLVLLLILLSASDSNSTEPQYMVLVPSLLHTEAPKKGCVLLSHLNETVTVSASLESGRENRSLFTDLVAEKDLFHCVSFTLPRISASSEVAFLSIQIKGPTQDFRKRNTVLVLNTQSLVFVQTDKPMYKPGQTVRFRVVSVDENFRPRNELIPLIYLENPRRNRIAQWQSLKLEAGINQLSFPLSSEPIQGSYRVVVQTESGGRIQHPFTVEEFVLPKFEVKVQVPKIISIMDEKVNITVCGEYTYGKPVPGLATVSLCRKLSRVLNCDKQEVCEEFSQQLNSNGCITQQVHTKMLQITNTGFEMKLRVEARIREEGTDLEVTANRISEITNIVSKLKFVKVDSHFRQGIPFFAQVLLVDGKGVPIPNKLFFISVNDANYYSNATTNEQGLAQFSINTTSISVNKLFVRVFTVHPNLCFHYSWVAEDHQGAQHTANRVFSLSGSYIHLEPVAGTLPCGHTETITAHYTLNRQAMGELSELSFHYLIMAKGVIVRSGTHTLPVESGDMKGSFALSFPVESDVAPIARMFIFAILPDGEVVGDSEKFEIENCLANKVDLSFSPAQSPPASHAHLQVAAAPQSLCALRAVDQSVLLMKPEAELSVSSVYNLLTVKDLTNFPDNVDQQEEEQGHCPRPFFIHNGAIYVPLSSNEADIYSFLKGMGLKVFTNSKIRKPKSCSVIPSVSAGAVGQGYYGAGLGVVERPYVPQLGTYNVIPLNNEQSSGPVPETVRSYFPETWIWELVAVNSSGVAEVGVTVPDTITEWKAGAFCLSEDAGLGISSTASLRAFQPFFVELTMPYSVIRGEVFTLKATVLNYLPKCIRVSVQLKASPAFLASQNTKGEESYCICGNERQTLSWTVTPKTLGNVNFSVSAEAMQSLELCGNEVVEVPEIKRKDTVIKTLLVEAEGIEQEKTFSSMTCASGANVSEQLSLKLPSNVVKESARASFSVLGDILGSAMQNIQNLLQMPYGCGEQNMVLFAPNIYVLNYLNETQQLTQEIKAKAVGYLITGYQRQLNYKHQDGSYSTFGERYGRNQGNTWLTAFVLKTFAQARSYIFIDEAHITQSLTWLSQMQKDNGCFRSSGSLLNNAIKGGVEDEATLSAYVTIALLEIPLPVTNPIVRNALFCLESAWNVAKEGTHGSHVYTKALLAYAFSLLGKQNQNREILNSLDKEAVKEDNLVHWERPQRPKAPVGHLYQTQAPSAEVEMTSYVLLAYLTAQPAPTSGDLTSATNIVKWIMKQQNAQGGFSSTQDTVVALHALSRYGAATFTRTEKTAQVTVQDSQTFSTNFQVDNNNLLLLQQISLPELPGEYVITVTGERCVYLQTSMKYNILPEKEDSPFALKVQTVPQTCDGHKAHTSFQISLTISYTGNRPASNMVIVDVKMVSGFIPLKPTVKMLERSSSVSRTEVSNNHVLIYVEQVTNQTLSFSFMVLQDIPVGDLKPAIVKVYDYYETDESVVAEYIAPCSTDTEHGNV